MQISSIDLTITLASSCIMEGPEYRMFDDTLSVILEKIMFSKVIGNSCSYVLSEHTKCFSMKLFRNLLVFYSVFV